MGAAATVLAYLASPVPQTREDCNLYKVNQKAVTAFVLKPPPGPIVEKICPPAPIAKCESAAPEEKSDEAKKSDDQPRHRRYHHRVRRYWR